MDALHAWSAEQSSSKAPAPWLVGVGTVIALGANQLLPATWAGTAVNVAALAVLGRLLLRWSRREDWSRGHVLAAAGAALIVRAALSFLVEPFGEVDLAAKYAVNAAMLAGVIALLVLAARRIKLEEAAACLSTLPPTESGRMYGGSPAL